MAIEAMVLWMTLLVAILFLVVVVLFTLGGRLVLAKLKSKLPGYKGKGLFWLHLYKSGTFFLDFVKMDKENKIRTKNGETIIINAENLHSLVDMTTGDPKDYVSANGFVSIHKLDKTPLVMTVEGGPTNVVAKYRDYEEDVAKIKVIIKYLSKEMKKENLNELKKANKKLISFFYNLQNSFKYLPKANNICKQHLTIYNPNKIYNVYDYQHMLKLYKEGLEALTMLLRKKTHSFVNFNELFNSGNLSALFNKMSREFMQLGRLSTAKKNESLDKRIKIAGMIAMIVLGLIGYLVLDQGNQIEDLTHKINGMNKNINQLIVDTPNSNSANADVNTDVSNPVTNGSLAESTKPSFTPFPSFQEGLVPLGY